MPNGKNFDSILRNESEKSTINADAISLMELKKLTRVTTRAFEVLRQDITDMETYNKLIDIINDAKQNKIDLVSLRDNITRLGPKGIQVVKEVSSLFKWGPIALETQPPDSAVLIHSGTKSLQSVLSDKHILLIGMESIAWIRQGSTSHFTVYYDPSLGNNGTNLANNVLATCENEYSILKYYFENIDRNFNVYIQPGFLGAYHYGGGGTDLYCDAFNGTDADLVRSLVLAEAAEVFMFAQNAGWDPAGSNGEALSRIISSDRYPNELTPSGLNVTFATGSDWLDSCCIDILENGNRVTRPVAIPRPDWVDATERTDRHFISIGCGTLFINWLRFQLGLSTAQIIQAGGSTLAETFTKLTGGTDGFDQFKALIEKRYPACPAPGNPCANYMSSGLTTDNPFPIGKEIDGILLVPRYPRDNYVPPIPREIGPIFVIYGKARFQIPNDTVRARLFPNEPIYQLMEAQLDSIDTVPVDGTLLREESNPQVYIVQGGKKKPVPGGATGQVHVLWDGALAQIEIWPSGLSGIVTDTEGNPIDRAAVTIIARSVIISPGYGNSLQMSTDSRGLYSSVPVPLPPDIYDVYTSQSGFIDSHVAVTIQAGEDITQNFVLEQQKPSTVSGKVMDTKGAPIQGATVKLIHLPTIRFETTDPIGFYAITVSDPYLDYNLYAIAPGYVTKAIGIHIPNGGTITQDFVLSRLGVLIVNVKDVNGTPISSAGVQVFDVNPMTGDPKKINFSGSTDSTGRCSLIIDPPGSYYVIVLAAGFETCDPVNISVPIETIITQNIALVKAVPTTITGKVTDSDGIPINNASVGAFYAGADQNEAETDSAGNYTLNVLSGWHWVGASAKWYSPATAQLIKLIGGQTLILNFVLQLTPSCMGARPQPPCPGPMPA